MTTNMIPTLLSTDRTEQHTASGHWRDRTIYMEVAEHARRAPCTFAVRDQRRRLTYGQLIDAADSLAAEMAARGIRVGQRVAVWLPEPGRYRRRHARLLA
jgi:non-ribosomal peptide synthetase component E (peptide arylation enzyme)